MTISMITSQSPNLAGLSHPVTMMRNSSPVIMLTNLEPKMTRPFFLNEVTLLTAGPCHVRPRGRIKETSQEVVLIPWGRHGRLTSSVWPLSLT